MRPILAALLVLSALPVQAGSVAWEAARAACEKAAVSAADLINCKGTVFTACMREGGEAEIEGLDILCQQNEAGAWQARLDQLWPDLAAAAKANGMAGGLAASQQAWDGFVAAQCGLVGAMADAGGALPGYEAQACAADLAADRVFQVLRMLDGPS